jgi:dephospho-CoA kinase
MTYVVALTGGIGSGKSTVANYFASLGVPIIDADLIARDLVKPHTSAYQAIVEQWGNGILLPNGELNRVLLREHIFNNPNDKIWLENLLHPLIREAIKKDIQKIQSPYCLVVIPLLAEHYSHYQAMINEVIVIDVMPEQQLARTLGRDPSSASLVKKIMAAQSTRIDRLKIAQTLLSNQEELASIEKKVLDLHTKLLKTSISGKI